MKGKSKEILDLKEQIENLEKEKFSILQSKGKIEYDITLIVPSNY